MADSSHRDGLKFEEKSIFRQSKMLDSGQNIIFLLLLYAGYHYFREWIATRCNSTSVKFQKKTRQSPAQNCAGDHLHLFPEYARKQIARLYPDSSWRSNA